MIKLLARGASLLGFVAVLSGCVVGQQLQLDTVPGSTVGFGEERPVTLVVEDRRPATTC